MKKRFWFFASIAIIILDQVSKYWISTTLIPYKPIPIFPMLNITLAYNNGAAFGFLNGNGEWHKWFFAIFSLTVSLILILWLWRSSIQDKLQSAGLSLILGGAIGNLIDRGLHGYVIDFIDVYYKHHHFATFNLADSAICIGAGLLLLELILPKHKKQVKN